jgi:hypothetical protein
MDMNMIWRVGLLCVLVLIAFAMMSDMAYASESVTGDKDMATKKGVSESLGNKKFDKDKLPSKTKIGFALGSVVAAVAVFKWL